jgi:hypothetical protein
MGTHDPAAAQLAGGTFEIFFAEAETGQDSLGASLKLKTVMLGVSGVGIDIVMLMVIGMIIGLDSAAEADHIVIHADGDFDNGFVTDLGSFLGEVTDGGAAIEGDVTAIGFLALEDHIDEGGFACAIGSDEANAFAAIDLEGGLDEEVAVAKTFTNFADREH